MQHRFLSAGDYNVCCKPVGVKWFLLLRRCVASCVLCGLHGSQRDRWHWSGGAGTCAATYSDSGSRRFCPCLSTNILPPLRHCRCGLLPTYEIAHAYMHGFEHESLKVWCSLVPLHLPALCTHPCATFFAAHRHTRHSLRDLCLSQAARAYNMQVGLEHRRAHRPWPHRSRLVCLQLRLPQLHRAWSPHRCHPLWLRALRPPSRRASGRLPCHRSRRRCFPQAPLPTTHSSRRCRRHWLHR